MDNWQKQTDKPLFPDLLWSRPQTKKGAGKLLIIGGQAQGFSLVAAAYAYTEKAGAGTVRVIMPDSTKKTAQNLPNIEYAPSNAIGSFAKSALSELLEESSWADGVLIAGDLGKNSETTLMLENYLEKTQTLTVLTSSAIESFDQKRHYFLVRSGKIIVLSSKQLKRLGIELGLKEPIISNIGIPKLAQLLHEITLNKPGSIMCEHSDLVWVSSKGQVASTPVKTEVDMTKLAAYSAVWTMQNPAKIFEALTSACYDMANEKN